MIWWISHTLNALMACPNLIAVLGAVGFLQRCAGFSQSTARAADTAPTAERVAMLVRRVCNIAGLCRSILRTGVPPGRVPKSSRVPLRG